VARIHIRARSARDVVTTSSAVSTSSAAAEPLVLAHPDVNPGHPLIGTHDSSFSDKTKLLGFFIWATCCPDRAMLRNRVHIVDYRGADLSGQKSRKTHK